MKSRVQILFFGFLVSLGAIVLRLAYWQLIRGQELGVQAREQYTSQQILYPHRGSIITADGFPLVVNTPVYSLTSYSPNLKEKPKNIVDQVLPLINFQIDDPAIATDEARVAETMNKMKQDLNSSMLDGLSNKNYAILARNLSVDEKHSIENLHLDGLNFDESFVRGYPEASMSAHLAGFVGRNDLGEPTGYFGLEGFYNRELAGQPGIEKQEKDAVGNPLMIGDYRQLATRDGRTLKLNVDRSVQYIAEEELKKGIERYGAASGEILIMDPTTGGILAMASLPTYDPAKFYEYDTSLYKNPSVADAYEPGSTFKVLVLAAAINENKVKIDDRCDVCNGPLPIDKYVIKTWNNQYHPDSTPAEIIANSDNVGMVWVERKLGGDKMVDYLKNFGFGDKTGIDLQEEIAPALRPKWGDIDYATSSFGQGIAVTSIEMVRAVAAIASGGKLMEPHVVSEVIGDTTTQIEPKVVRQVITKDTADKMTDIMIGSAEHGDAKWTRLPDYTVAGKTGTAQIPVAGHYDADKTIASFVGFAPAHNPRFVMLVKLREPQTSQWGSETAAPLWFTVARKLLMHYQIPPDIKK